jgi:hypothetical protein
MAPRSAGSPVRPAASRCQGTAGRWPCLAAPRSPVPHTPPAAATAPRRPGRGRAPRGPAAASSWPSATPGPRPPRRGRRRSGRAPGSDSTPSPAGTGPGRLRCRPRRARAGGCGRPWACPVRPGSPAAGWPRRRRRSASWAPGWRSATGPRTRRGRDRRLPLGWWERPKAPERYPLKEQCARRSRALHHTKPQVRAHHQAPVAQLDRAAAF